MKVNDWLKYSVTELKYVGIATARLDALILLEDASGKDRAWLLAYPEFELPDKIVQKLNQQIEQRAKHEPLAYIRGKSEFYGREFLVTPDTLQPRPETETMITLLKNLLQHNSLVCREAPCKLVDVGTGSGCLAVTAKLEWPEVEVYATEINKEALKVARQNAKNLNADVKFYKGNLLEPFYNLKSIIYNPFAILANLPYVPDSHTINEAAMQEPKIAIFGGEDGLDLYREMFHQVSKRSGVSGQGLAEKPEYILTESLPFQHEALAKIAKKHGYKQTATEDLIQVFI